MNQISNLYASRNSLYENENEPEDFLSKMERAQGRSFQADEALAKKITEVKTLVEQTMGHDKIKGRLHSRNLDRATDLLRTSKPYDKEEVKKNITDSLRILEEATSALRKIEAEYCHVPYWG
jgi:hypothetical protein